MAYIDSILGQGEEKLFVAHRHIIFLIARIALRVLAALVLIAAGIALKANIGGNPGAILLLICLALALFFGFQIFFLLLQWQNEMYVITQYRVIKLEGVFGKRTEDSSLNMINDLMLNQSLWGRLLNFGDLEIVTGNDIGDTLDGIARPLEFKRALLAAREHAFMPAQQYAPAMPQGYTAPLPAAPTPQTPEEITALIARLADLRDRGAISQQEFDEKRAELLRRI